MIWQAPLALAGLLLVAGPILVHLLVRRHAARVLFPGMRFVPAAQGAAVRPRRPSDPAWLLVRCGAVAAAALAVAQPLLVTRARHEAWAARVARAVVVDTSPSVDASIAGPLADAERRGAAVSERIASAELHDAVASASAWLRTAAAGTREIVVVSDFQSGALDGGDLANVPAGIGIRFVRAGRPMAAARETAASDGWHGGRWTASIGLDASGTRVGWQRTADASPPRLRVLTGEADRAAADRAARAAASFGVTAGDVAHPIEIAFAGANPDAATAPSTPWIAAAAIGLAADPLVAASGAPLSVAERDGMLVASTPLPGSSPFAPALVRAILQAASPRFADRELEREALDDASLARWQRAPVRQPGMVPPDAEDGRWLWGLALALLIVEEGLRRRAARPVEETHARAA
jgi:aerotolerance regulator-like protein